LQNGDEHSSRATRNFVRAKRQTSPRVKECLNAFIANEGNYAERDIVHPLRRQLFAGNASKRHEFGTCRMDVSSNGLCQNAISEKKCNQKIYFGRCAFDSKLLNIA